MAKELYLSSQKLILLKAACTIQNGLVRTHRYQLIIVYVLLCVFLLAFLKFIFRLYWISLWCFDAFGCVIWMASNWQNSSSAEIFSFGGLCL